jgi:hypothetical protein
MMSWAIFIFIFILIQLIDARDDKGPLQLCDLKHDFVGLIKEAMTRTDKLQQLAIDHNCH